MSLAFHFLGRLPGSEAPAVGGDGSEMFVSHQKHGTKSRQGGSSLWFQVEEDFLCGSVFIWAEGRSSFRVYHRVSVAWSNEH